jgi:predicted Ser/Thr protein kinase
MIGEYTIDKSEELGKGGFGIVYKAWNIDEPRACKVIQDEFFDDNEVNLP